MFAFGSVRLLGFAVTLAFLGILVAAYFSGNHIVAESANVDTLSRIKADRSVFGNPSPSPTPEAEHWHVAAYYDLENFPSAKFLLNNKDIVAREVRSTLYSLDGLAMEVPPVWVDASSAVMIDLEDWAGPGGSAFRRGSIKIFHTGKDRVIGSQVYLEDTANGLSFEERLAELGKFDSRRLEGIWYMPRNQTDATIILSNTSDQMLTVNAKLSKNPRQSSITEQFLLLPHQTRVLDLKTDFRDGADFALGRVVGLSITHNGANSDLKAHGLVKDLARGYSNIIRFTNPDKAKSSEFHGTGLHLGQFGGEELTPLVIVKNVGTVPANVTAKVNYTRVDGTTGSVSLDPVGFRTGEMRPLNMDAVIHRARKEQIDIAGIEVTSDAEPGSIIVSTQSIGKDLDQVFRVPMSDAYAQVSSTGGYPWRIDATSSTYAYIKNTTLEEQEYVSYLTWEGTEYMIGLKKIAPGQTVEIDVKKLRDQQIPDERGNFVPLNLTEGQLQWTIRADRFDEGEPLKKFKLVGRSEQIDLVNKTSSSYACQNCCQMWAVGWISSGGITEVEVGDQIQFVAYEQGTTCNGTPYGPYLIDNDDVDWDSNHDDIATVTDLGLVTIVGVGDFEIDGDWYRPMTSDQGGYCPGPYLTGGSERKPEDEKPSHRLVQNFVPDCTVCHTEETLIDSDVELVAKPKVEILRNGQTIASPRSTPVTQNVVVGEKIELTTRVTGGSGTSQWTLPTGKAIKNYVVTITDGKAVRAEKTDLETSDLNQSTVTIYWVDGGNPLDVKYTVTINGTPRSATAKFNVKKPTSTLTTTTSNVSLGNVLISEMPSESVFALHYGSPFGTPGIQFEASVSLPSGVTGQTVWAQVVNTLRRRTPTEANQQTLQGVGLDGVFPDLIDNAVNEDSPLQPAEPPCSYTSISAADSFNTWILFKPTIANVTTIYVPLKKVAWSWAGLGTRGSDCNSWKLSDSSRTENPTGVNTTDFPVWIANVEDFQWQ